MAPVFGDDAGRRLLAGIALGNEPDLTYSADLARYLGEFPAYSAAEHVNAWPRLIPATSENIGTWQSIRDRTINTRWFWNWPTILDNAAPVIKDKPGVLGPFATDHFYPMARTCASDPYRCPSIERLLAQERLDSFNYEVYTHATEAANRGLLYRMDETNTAAGRGAPGVSDTAASATWTLDTLFNAACPQPPTSLGPTATATSAPRASTSTTRRSTGTSPRGGQRLLQRDPLRPLAREGKPDAGAVLLRAAAVRAARAGDDGPPPGRTGRDRSSAWSMRGPPVDRGVCS